MRVRSRHWLRLLLAAALPSSAAAQVVLDGTVGSAGPGPVAAGLDDQGQSATYLIHDGLGERSEQNLFHSFSRFDVGPGETATFTSSSPVPPDNVLARVTGGSESQIYGRLRSTIPGADLWLINPAGWLFGAGSSLDVPGALHVTSGEYVRHADGTRFAVGLESAPALSIAPVEAFGFLDSAVGKLTVEDTRLELSANETLSLVGGDIGIHGAAAGGADTVRVPSGRINLVAVASPGEAVLDDSHVDPQLDVDSFAHLGRIEISDGARVVYAGDPGGTAVIRADSFLLDRAFLDGTTLDETNHPGVSADVEVRGEFSILGGEGQLARLESTTVGSGRGGSIRVRAGALLIEDTRVRCNAGVCCVGATCTGLASDSYGGAPGDIDLQLGRLEVAGGRVAAILARRFAPSTASDGGAIRIVADEVLIDDGVVMADSGPLSLRLPVVADAGDISIRAGRLETRGWSVIRAETYGSGRAGDIHIAADALSLHDEPGYGRPSGGISARSFGAGNGGDILIEGRDVSLSGNVHVGAGSFDPVWLWKDLGPALWAEPGNAGSVTLRVDDLRVVDGAAIGSSTVSGGHGGDVRVSARSVLVAGTGSFAAGHVGVISAFSWRAEDAGLSPTYERLYDRPAGDGGSIFIEAEEVTVDGGTIISSTSSEGAAGGVTIRANRLVATSAPGNHRFSIESDSYRTGSSVRDSNEVLPYQHGPAGNVTLIGIGSDSELRVEGTAIVSANTGTPAPGGNLFIDFDRVVVDGGRLSVGSFLPGVGHPQGSVAERNATGLAGDLRLIARDALRLTNGGSINAESVRSDGGHIDIRAGKAVELFGSSITTKSGANGGNISIDPKWVILQDASQVSAEAIGGRGGNISIQTQGLFVSPDSTISASSQYGLSGTVAVDAPESNLSGELASLTQDYLDAASLISDRCGTGNASAGSFAVNEGLAVAPAPDGALSSPLLELSTDGLAQTH